MRLRWLFVAYLLAGLPVAAAAVSLQVTQITDNAVPDMGGSIDGGHIAWLGFVLGGAGFQLFHVNEGAPVQVSSTASQPSGGAIRVSGSAIVWQTQSGTLAWFDGASVAPYPVQPGVIRSLDFEGNTIAYTKNQLRVTPNGVEGSFEVFLDDGSGPRQLTTDLTPDAWADLAGTHAAWVTGPNATGSHALGRALNQPPTNAGGSISFYDGAATRTLSSNISFHPSVQGDRVAWYGWDGSDYEIYYFDGATVRQLTFNGFEDRGALVSDAGVAWYGWDGGDYELYFFDGGSTTQLTNDAVEQLLGGFSGSTLIWQQWDGADFEIFVGSVLPEPAAAAMLTIAGVALLERFRRRTKRCR